MKIESWMQWILWGIILLIVGLSSYAVARVDNMQVTMSRDYVQKADYRVDISRLDSGITCLNEKMDTVIMRLH
jgi:ABC-type phosphate/phosphonate transport system permease subunit